MSNKQTVVRANTRGESQNAAGKEGEKDIYSLAFYTDKIPSDEKVIDSISKERNYAYYQLGLIYKEKFKEYNLSKDKFQELLQSNPEERLILPSKYNLYKIYELLGENDEATIAKNDIILAEVAASNKLAEALKQKGGSIPPDCGGFEIKADVLSRDGASSRSGAYENQNQRKNKNRAMTTNTYNNFYTTLLFHNLIYVLSFRLRLVFYH
mgnify:CR=1 FL=1